MLLLESSVCFFSVEFSSFSLSASIIGDSFLFDSCAASISDPSFDPYLIFRLYRLLRVVLTSETMLLSRALENIYAGSVPF